MRNLLAILVLLGTALAQEPLGLKGPMVTLMPVPTAVITQGKPGTAHVTFRVANGFHINSNRPHSEFLIPTTLKMSATTDIVIGSITYPEGEDASFAFAPDEKLSVYTRDFDIGVLVRPLRSVQTGRYVIRGTLRYQACDNSACYPPKNLPVSFEVKIAKAAPPPRKNPAQSPHAHR